MLQADSLPVEPPGKSKNTGVEAPSPVDLPDPGIKLVSPAELPGKPLCIYVCVYIYIFWLCWVFCCCTQASSGCSEQRLLFVAAHGLLIVVASLVVEHRLWVHELPWMQRMGSRAWAQ